MFRGGTGCEISTGEGQETKAGRNSQSVTTMADEVRRELNCSLDEMLTSDIAIVEDGRMGVVEEEERKENRWWW